MRFVLDDLRRDAAATGFSVDMLEKASRLLALLDAIRSHPFLGSRVALKGGTALNLFVFDLPRLSVDVDLNYTGALQREVMVAERPKVDQAIHALCGREELGVRRVPDEHAGGCSWVERGSCGATDRVELTSGVSPASGRRPAEPSRSRSRSATAG